MSIFAEIHRKMAFLGGAITNSIVPACLRLVLVYVLLTIANGISLSTDSISAYMITYGLYIMLVLFGIGFATRPLSLVLTGLLTATVLGYDVIGISTMHNVIAHVVTPPLVKNMLLENNLSYMFFFFVTSVALFALGSGRFSVDAIFDHKA